MRAGLVRRARRVVAHCVHSSIFETTGGWVGLGGSTACVIAIVHFGSVGRLWGLFERSKAT